ncbi:MAG: DUF3769 domain-containing protein [Elainellaceae cyanobacterium]
MPYPVPPPPPPPVINDLQPGDSALATSTPHRVEDNIVAPVNSSPSSVNSERFPPERSVVVETLAGVDSLDQNLATSADALGAPISRGLSGDRLELPLVQPAPESDESLEVGFVTLPADAMPSSTRQFDPSDSSLFVLQDSPYDNLHDDPVDAEAKSAVQPVSAPMPPQRVAIPEIDRLIDPPVRHSVQLSARGQQHRPIETFKPPESISVPIPRVRRVAIPEIDRLIDRPAHRPVNLSIRQQQDVETSEELFEDLSDSLESLSERIEQVADAGEAIPPLEEWETVIISGEGSRAQAQDQAPDTPTHDRIRQPRQSEPEPNDSLPLNLDDSLPLDVDESPSQEDDSSQENGDAEENLDRERSPDAADDPVIPEQNGEAGDDANEPLPNQTDDPATGLDESPSGDLEAPLPSDQSDPDQSDDELPSDLDPAEEDPAAPAAPPVNLEERFPDASEPPTPARGPSAEEPTGEALELTSDRQTYDQFRRIFIAEGNVELLFREIVLNAERVQVNLPNRVAVAEGNIVITRGEQVLRGDRLVYNLTQDQGSIQNARGEVFLAEPTAPTRTTPVEEDEALPPGDRAAQEQPPVEGVFSSGGININLSGGRVGGVQGQASGTIQRVRFEADEIMFTASGWEATNVRITNDPFSPPELEIRSNRATFRQLGPGRSELRARNPRLVIDQGFSIPLLRERVIIDNRSRNAGLVTFGFDQEDRGGLFVERTFEPFVNPFFRLSITPQILLQRAIDNSDGIFSPQNFGLVANLDANIDLRTTFESEVTLTSLDFGDEEFADDNLRALVRLRRQVLNNHTVTLEYNYRDRLFNGSLGFQTVDESFGVIFTSPIRRLGNTGIDLSYQASIQRITDDINGDRIDDILGPFDERENDIGTLTRYQVAAELRRLFFLWSGTALPPTPEEGLKYTPNPVVPFIAVLPTVRGVMSYYSSGDTQPILTGRLTLLGQFGQFSRPYFDYLGFNVSYSRSTDGSESPFNFDRVADREVFSAGVTAQLYGPFRFGFQTFINLDSGDGFDTSYILEYSRRTFGVTLRYNPDRETGSLGLRISDFNWTGTPAPFDSDRTVESGVTLEQL